MTNLLLITDVPRLRKIFSRFSDEKNIRLRIANSLEKGGEEIIADKPDMVFVQTHLSGLSADILLMHLKKQLGRKRTRFVLLSPPDQVSADVLKLYHGHLDTSSVDSVLSDALREMVAGVGAKRKSGEPAEAPPTPSQPLRQATSEAASAKVSPVTDISLVEHGPASPATAEPPAPLVLQQIPEQAEPSLEEQGVTYAPRPQLSVYSEFTNSFDTAVSTMQPAEPVTEPNTMNLHDWNNVEAETVSPPMGRSKRTMFFLWLAPVLVAVIVVTVIQHRKSQSKAVVVATAKPGTPAVASKHPMVIPPIATDVKPAPAPVPAAAQKPAVQPPATGADAQLSERAVLTAIEQNRGRNGQAKAAPAGARPTALPDFIPRYGFDKKYGEANPGWERYKGEVTEFKVYREGASIKAIQVIDRGGQGVPESFMKGVLKQVSKKPVFSLEASDRKEGYEIQRGQLGDDLKVVYYRDEQGGRLRAFVMTWK